MTSRLTEFRSGRWWVARALLVVCVGIFVLSAADADGFGRPTLVVFGMGIAGLIGYAWHRDEVTTREVILFAVLFRLIAFPLLPSLSDDGFRYIWDGWLQVRGVNPYLFRPTGIPPELMAEPELFARLNSGSYYSVYPPASQLVFLIGSFVGGGSWLSSWYVIKATFLAIEGAGLWALSRMVSPRSLMLYAWHPLVLIELAGQAHTEAGMVGLLLLSFLAYRSDHSAMSVAALTAAGWFKLYPLLLLPFLLRRVGWRYISIAGILSAVMVLPYAAPNAISHVRESLDLYVRLFEFNSGPYLLLKEAGLAWTGEDWSKLLGPVLRGAFLLGVGLLLHP